MKDWWVKNREVFDTDACGELVVNNSVEHGSNDASNRDFKRFHRVASLDRILNVVTSPYHSLAGVNERECLLPTTTSQPYGSLQMRLIWKKYDSEFNPIVTVVGFGALVGGIWGLDLLRHALREPLVWVLAAIPLLAIIIGVVTLVREYQLWKAVDK